MEYDNTRDRTKYGYDAGHIVDGKVAFDTTTGEYVIVDEDGVGFSVQQALKELEGKQIRFTCISFEAMQDIANMLPPPDPDNSGG